MTQATRPQAPQRPRESAPQPRGRSQGPTNGNRGTANSPRREFSIRRGLIDCAERVVLYGTGGIGKSTLASFAPNPIFLDIDGGTSRLDVARVDGVETWQDMRDALRSDIFAQHEGSVVIDSLSAAQRLAVDHTVKTVKHEKGHAVTSIEGYGFGKGYQHVLEEFLVLLGDLETLLDRGTHVILIAHETTALAPNPDGEDFPRYEPDLQQPPRTGRLRDYVKNWTDHLVFIAQDRVVIDRKAQGEGTRTAYFEERPTFWAKSRSGSPPLQFSVPTATNPDANNSAPDIWNVLLGHDKE